MDYFKIIVDNNIIGVITPSQFIRYSPATDNLLRCEKERGEYIIYKDKFYRDNWMNAPQVLLEYIPATILPITEEEYNLLFEALEKQEIIVIEDDTIRPDYPVDPEPYEDTTTIDFLRSSKISEMSSACKKAIESGIDFNVRGETKHFSFTIQDQLNLMSINAAMQTGELIPYHADGEVAIFYTETEIKQLISALNAHKSYHTAYFNALKNYINSLETIEDIAAITYGIEIPEAYQSEVLKVMG